jgi:hypothetical protein
MMTIASFKSIIAAVSSRLITHVGQSITQFLTVGDTVEAKNLYPQPAATEGKYGNPGMAVSNARYFFVPLKNVGTSASLKLGRA